MKPIDGFSVFDFTADGDTRPVYFRGSGPGVILMHELPGMIPECVDLGNRIAAAGFTVFMPLLLGEANQPFSIPKTLGYAAKVCLSREFSCFAKGESSPITDWLRSLCGEVKKRCGGSGVGAIGMCLTGGFVLSLMADETAIAPVACQPSLPFPISKEHQRDLGISDAQRVKIKEKIDRGGRILALRFSEDRTCPAERFVRLREEFGEGVETIEIDSSSGNPHNIPQSAHATLTVHYCDRPGHPTRQAFERILEFFRDRLRGGNP